MYKIIAFRWELFIVSLVSHYEYCFFLESIFICIMQDHHFNKSTNKPFNLHLRLMVILNNIINFVNKRK